MISLSDDISACKAWLSSVESSVSFGDVTSDDALVLGLASSGLTKLGLKENDLATFPVIFQDGMAAPWRARALGDVEKQRPEVWEWGNMEDKKRVDAILLIYANDADRLIQTVASRQAELELHRHVVVQRIQFKPLGPERPQTVFGTMDGISQPIIRGTRKAHLARNSIHLVEPGEFVLGYLDNCGYLPVTPTVEEDDDPGGILPALDSDPLRQRPDAGLPQQTRLHDFGRNGSFLVVRQLEQHNENFADYCKTAPRPPGSHPDWIAAKMIGRWKNGSSLVRHPYGPPAITTEGDNDFLFGAEDPDGQRCPLGAHIRRANPRDSLEPDNADDALSVTNRHRILRVGRSYTVSQADKAEGLFFMCLNADIERQFEFVQQTWMLAPSFQGLMQEVDPIAGRGDGHVVTVPTPHGPMILRNIPDFITMRGGGYFFVPGKRALRYLAA